MLCRHRTAGATRARTVCRCRAAARSAAPQRPFLSGLSKAAARRIGAGWVTMEVYDPTALVQKEAVA
ncbi:hypothetical protein GCM10010384_54960 [Streptomyces djakartensis]|uniref:Uncharacterized protein n=1 Tax=Streptomyces djakartensis TaxID=68193 RepID=A0ABQ3AB90_9ACTN|nr:hypothetical protein GCM10010384_54960 [Streptomyces djakartensis]